MRTIYILNKAARTMLAVWMGLVFLVVLSSQAERFRELYGREVAPEELSVETEHFDERTYICYTEEGDKKEWEGALVCVGDKKSYWTKEQLAALPQKQQVDTSIEVLTVTLPSKSIIFRKNTVSYLKYGCLGESAFTEEEIRYYKQAAARRFTYERHLKMRMKDAAAYKQFIPNENID